MFDRTKPCMFLFKMTICLDNCMHYYSLRQGTIIIAVQQIMVALIMVYPLLFGISYLGELQSMVRGDMEDDVEIRGLYEIVFGEKLTFHEGDVVSTNNQRRFAKSQHLASVTVIILYTATILLFIHLMSSISLLYGAVKYKREYVLPWLMMACVMLVFSIVAAVVGDGYPEVINFFRGHSVYHFFCAGGVLWLIYNICVVSSFLMETGSGRCARANRTTSDEGGERLLLLDHTAHSSLLSAAQLNKLSHGTRSQFV